MEALAREKSMNLAVEIVNLYWYLCDKKKEFVMSRKILHAGTCIGANLAEVECASSRSDMLDKLHAALKGCNETLYWLELLYRTNYLSQTDYEIMNGEAIDLRRSISTRIYTIRMKQ